MTVTKTKIEEDLAKELSSILSTNGIKTDGRPKGIVNKKELIEELVAYIMDWMQSNCDDCDRIHPDDIGEYIAETKVNEGMI